MNTTLIFRSEFYLDKLDLRVQVQQIADPVRARAHTTAHEEHAVRAPVMLDRGCRDGCGLIQTELLNLLIG